ncbi:flavodoxin family protein [Amycolatopsis jejuensis]|uniref:flavodoxin family protein n=1 Tax=Amycolatopsis jejuensis TaxID=330084 RepID=UPI0009FE179F|nr:flavodoxin family protein [Amycolatopsis jejuensis]
MPSLQITVAIACHGGRGHTARLAAAVGSGLETVPDIEVVPVPVTEMTPAQWGKLDEAAAIVFGAPTYMGTASAAFHAFAEASSRRQFVRRWHDKLAAGFTNSGAKAGDKSGTLGYFATLAAQHGMTWVNLGLPAGWNRVSGAESDVNRLGFFAGAAAQSNVDEKPEAMHESDLRTAEHLGRRVGEQVRIVVAGRLALANREAAAR